MEGTASPSTLARVAKAASHALEGRLDDVVGVAPGALRDVQRDRRGSRERLEEVLGDLGVERRVPERQHLAERDVVDDERSARQVEGDLDERLVERIQPAGEPSHADLVAERLSQTPRRP